MIYPEKVQTAAHVAEHYDSLNTHYLKLWGEHLHHGFWKTGNESVLEATEQLVDLIAAAGKIEKNHKVCDIGCGYGATDRLLVKKWGAEVTGITVSEAQWTYAKNISQEEENPRYVLADFLNNPFPSNHFDTVLSIESSEHMVDKEKFFKEVARILKPGGHFVTCAWLAKNEPKKWEVDYLLEPICREGRLPSMGSELEYRDFIEKVGLKELDFQDLSSSVKKTWAICSYRTAKAFFADSEIRKFILNKENSDRIFAKTVARIWLAYNLKVMRYGLFSAQKISYPR